MSLRLRSLFALSFLALVSVPQIAFAKLDLYNPHKKYRDEKTAINDPTSRCMTTVFQKLYNNAVTQADKDWAATKNKEAVSVKAAYGAYEKDILLAWEAMQQPYCGFGAFGATAAQKSFQKTLVRARTNYLAQVKSGAVPAKPETGTTATTTPASPPVVVKPVAKTVAVVKTTPLALTRVAITHTLERGQHSEEVKALQAYLVKFGFLDAEYATGFFGSYTETAVIAFQLKHRLIPSRSAAGAGIVGPKTRDALSS